MSVDKFENEPELVVGIDTFSQLSAGLYDLSAACYRKGTVLKNNMEILKQVFYKKQVYAS